MSKSANNKGRQFTKGKGTRKKKEDNKRGREKKSNGSCDTKAGGKTSSSTASTGSGGGATMIKVIRANDGAPLGYYKNKARASIAMTGDQFSAGRALKKKGDKKGVVHSDGLFKVEEVHNCTEPEGPTALGMQEGKWKMKDHAPGPGSGSNKSCVGDRLGSLLNKSSTTKINGDKGGRTIGDAFQPIRFNGEVCDGLVIYDGDLFAGLMALESKVRISQQLKRLRKKGSNKASSRMDNGKQGQYPQYWRIDGLRPGLENYSDFTMA